MKSDNQTTHSKADEVLARERDIALSLAAGGILACEEWDKVIDILERAEGPNERAGICAALLGIGAELRELNETLDDLNEHGIVTYTR